VSASLTMSRRHLPCIAVAQGFQLKFKTTTSHYVLVLNHGEAELACDAFDDFKPLVSIAASSAHLPFGVAQAFNWAASRSLRQIAKADHGRGIKLEMPKSALLFSGGVSRLGLEIAEVMGFDTSRHRFRVITR
jgi:hypothetical protein